MNGNATATALNKPKLDNRANEIWKSAERLRHQLLSDAAIAANGTIKLISSLESGAGDSHCRWLVTESTLTLQAKHGKD